MQHDIRETKKNCGLLIRLMTSFQCLDERIIDTLILPFANLDTTRISNTSFNDEQTDDVKQDITEIVSLDAI